MKGDQMWKQISGKWTMDGFDPITDIPDGAFLTSFYSGNVSDARMQKMLDFVETCHADLGPEKVFQGLDQVKEAHRYLESSESFGKVVIRVHRE